MGKRIVVAFTATWLAALYAGAAGYMLSEMGARGNAMGGALVGDTGDATAVYFNPAGMVNVPGAQASAGFTMVRPRMDIRMKTPNGLVDAKNYIDWWPLPALFYTQQLNDNWWAGVGVYVPFGLGSQFDSSWAGRYSNYDAVIESFNVNPSFAWKISDRFSVGAGLVVNFSEFKIKRKMPNTEHPELGDIDFYLDSDWNVNVAGNIGIRYKILDNLQWGATYHSPIHQDLTGRVRMRLQSPVGLKEFASVDAECGFDFPGLATTGFNYQPTDRWNLGVSVGYTEWSYYDGFDIKFKEPLNGNNSACMKRDWNNVWRLAFGAEYQALDWLWLRCGYIFDEEPGDDSNFDYMVPANDRHIFSFGLGFDFTKDLSLDLGYTYVKIADRDNVPARPAEGVYETSVSGKSRVLSASVSYKF